MCCAIKQYIIFNLHSFKVMLGLFSNNKNLLKTSLRKFELLKKLFCQFKKACFCFLNALIVFGWFHEKKTRSRSISFAFECNLIFVVDDLKQCFMKRVAAAVLCVDKLFSSRNENVFLVFTEFFKLSQSKQIKLTNCVEAKIWVFFF